MINTEEKIKIQFIENINRWANKYAKTKNIEDYTLKLPSYEDIHIDEAEGFIRAIDASIVIVNEIGGCKLPNLHRADTKPTEVSSLFSNKKNHEIYLAWREYITQIGAVTSLCIDYKWPIELVALDPRDWTFDVAGFETTQKNSYMIIAGETKKTEKELIKLLSEMTEAMKNKLSLLELADTKKDGYKKYRGLLKEKPLYFWASAPGINKYYKLSYLSQEFVKMIEVKDMPDYFSIK